MDVCTESDFNSKPSMSDGDISVLILAVAAFVIIVVILFHVHYSLFYRSDIRYRGSYPQHRSVINIILITILLSLCFICLCIPPLRLVVVIVAILSIVFFLVV